MQASSTAPLFSGGTVPIYHPSLVPRGKAGSPHAPDGGLHPTSPEALNDLLRQLKTDRRTLEVRTTQKPYTLNMNDSMSSFYLCKFKSE